MSPPEEGRVATAEDGRRPLGLFLIQLALFLIVAIHCAWICDDAYIGFRVADNFAHGYGLTWNVAERVQVYTAPLWVLTVSLLNVATREVYYTSIVLSLIMSTVAVILLARLLSRSFVQESLVILAAISSKAFMDFTTSGLENALGYLLAAGFYVSIYRGASSFRLSLLGTLLVVNRADGILLVAPPLLYTLARRARWRDVAAATLGSGVFLLWEGFSLFYYGSFLPNTAYAKLNTGISRLDLVRQGFWYFSDSLTRDPATLAMIAIAIVMTASGKDGRSKSIAAGIALYLSYVGWIGGDFMSGRFFALPFVGAMTLLAVLPISTNVARTLCLITLALGLVNPYAPLLSSANYGSVGRIAITNEHGIADERAAYYPSTGLLKARASMARPFHAWALVGESTRLSGKTLVGHGNIGFLGYFAGPRVYVIDPGALADALLARLPIAPSQRWRVGHFQRPIPEGYLETLRTGRNKIADPAIARFYDRLRLAISGPLLSPERLVQVVRLVAGIDRPPAGFGEARRRVAQGSLTDEITFTSSGLEIDLDHVYHAEDARILLDNNDVYRIVFLRGRRPVGECGVAPAGEPSTTDMACYHINMPASAISEGYDRIDILPADGDGFYAIGGLSLSR